MAGLRSFFKRLGPTPAKPRAGGSVVRTYFDTAGAVARGAPHVRDAFGLGHAMHCVVIALVPCVFVAFYNTGLQANLAMAKLGITAAPGWRGAVLEALGIGHDPASFWADISHGAIYFLPVFVVTVVVAAIWERAFAHLRKRQLAEGFVVVPLLFSLALPPSIPLWQAALGISFGVVVGKEIFGGTGKNVFNPTLTGLAFLYVTYPKEMIGETAWTVVDAFTSATYLSIAAQTRPDALAWLATTWEQTFLGLEPGPFGTTSTLACLLGAAFLLYTRTASARIMAGVLFGMIGTVLLFNALGGETDPFLDLSWHWHLTLGSFAFGTVFLATDPATSAMTNTGRWIYGLLIGFLIVLIRVTNTNHPDGVMFAILFGNIFAPLIDYLVMRANIRRRARRDA